MSYRGNNINTSSDTASQFEAYFVPGAAPVITSNAPVVTTPAKVPEVAALARNTDGAVTIQASGIPGTPYRVQACSTLREEDWTTIAEGIITESAFTIPLTEQNEPQMFYRILMP